MNQTAFNFDAPPRQRHSPTSCAAADSIEPHLNRLVQMVLNAIRGAGERGLTDLEGQEVTDLDGSTYRPRRVWLTENGYVRNSGDTRLTKSNRKAVVWLAK